MTNERINRAVAESTFDRDLFERAFTSAVSSCRHTCRCGRTFWDGVNVCSWEPGEREALEKDKHATCLPHSVSIITFEGVHYAMDCDCWIDRAKKVTEWLANNGPQIAKWFNLRKSREMLRATSLPEVKL